jgi:hypothetical protein
MNRNVECVPVSTLEKRDARFPVNANTHFYVVHWLELYWAGSKREPAIPKPKLHVQKELIIFVPKPE